ncbi:MAG: ribonuclease HII [Candidatus Dadabacteria bacterium]|nr:ribonuclease HII [Candidatus Dadabacteria bacterium]NIQ13903.1 ribonuclease HII [Candidatus Dadabacteria bacterium]
MKLPDYSFEESLWNKSKLPAGLDEAGRGPLAGPVVAAAVIIDKNRPIQDLNDSKKLSEFKRIDLYHNVIENSLAYAIGIVHPNEIDEINILRATLKAMEIAVSKLNPKPSYLLIDGNTRTSLIIPQETIIKGDSKCASIAAASIIAKVSRDELMKEYDKQYPQYNFIKHKGYPTKNHLELIKIHGPCPIHRKFFKGVL